MHLTGPRMLEYSRPGSNLVLMEGRPESGWVMSAPLKRHLHFVLPMVNVVQSTEQTGSEPIGLSRLTS